MSITFTPAVPFFIPVIVPSSETVTISVFKLSKVRFSVICVSNSFRFKLKPLFNIFMNFYVPPTGILYNFSNTISSCPTFVTTFELAVVPFACCPLVPSPVILTVPSSVANP